MTLGWIDDERFELHEQEPGHPESPERVRAIREAVLGAPLASRLIHLQAREATRSELLSVHSPEYIDFVEETCLDREPAVLGPDVVVCRGSWLAAKLAAGSALAATQAVLDSVVSRAFCNLRPPGHHALPDQAMGFCIFNNIALAAKLALKTLDRVAIVDWDVHHGNGSEAIFQGDPRLLYASLHQFPFYPGTGSRSAGNALNLPLRQGLPAAAYMQAFEEKLLPALESFKPQLILISCGFDAHKADPLGGLLLDETHYAQMTQRLCACSELHSGGKIVSMLEGGYNLKAIAQSALSHMSVLAGLS